LQLWLCVIKTEMVKIFVAKTEIHDCSSISNSPAALLLRLPFCGRRASTACRNWCFALSFFCCAGHVPLSAPDCLQCSSISSFDVPQWSTLAFYMRIRFLKQVIKQDRIRRCSSTASFLFIWHWTCCTLTWSYLLVSYADIRFFNIYSECKVVEQPGWMSARFSTRLWARRIVFV